MKKILSIFFVLALWGASGNLNAQVINVPNKSEKHFAAKYPEAKNVDWTNSVTSYSARFTLNDEKYRANYHIDGTWDFTEKELDYGKLPAEVQDSFKKSRMSDWKVLGAALVDNSKNEKLYRVEVEKGVSKKYVFYDGTGKEVRTTLTL